MITPGQFGPTKIVSESLIWLLTLIISFTGIPSVIAIITLIPASAASIIALAANAGGTNIMLVFAFVSKIASATVLKTGKSKCF